MNVLRGICTWCGYDANKDYEQQTTMKKKLTLAQLNAIYNEKLPKPTDKEVAKTISKIEQKMAESDIDMDCNFAVKEGYGKALSMLRVRQTTYDGINELKTTQGRCIASLAVDYLNGRCRQSVLLGVPIKKM